MIRVVFLPVGDHLINRSYCSFQVINNILLINTSKNKRLISSASRLRKSTVNVMDSLKPVDIDEGKFKYVLIRVKEGDKVVHLVRGYKWAAYHADIFDHVEEKELQPLKRAGHKVSWSCPGGGRILHKPEEKTILIYGYSQGFGRPDHSISCDLVKEAYPGYSSITWSNDGY